MKNNEKKTSPPVVVVLGHVDHGKTTLLDAIRKTSVAQREVGGITQSISVSVITTKKRKKITFIDTPGHVAFSQMRSQGAKVADMAVLVVDAGAGVKPQTKEAIRYINQARIPFIVAVTKIDLQSASVETVKNQLEKAGIAFEGKGGDVPLISVSGKTGQGIEDLLEMITLVAEVNEIGADSSSKLEAVVIETSREKCGLLVSIILGSGYLKVNDFIMTDSIGCKVKGLFQGGRPVKMILAGYPGQILGFDSLPKIGSRIHSLEKKEVKQRAVPKIEKTKIVSSSKKIEEYIPILIKADKTGSLQALLTSIPDGISVLFADIGEVNQSDIFLAKTGRADICTFKIKTPNQIQRLAKTEGVAIFGFDVIYELFEFLEDLIKKEKEEIAGCARIVATFPFDDKKIAGCQVLRGRILKSENMILKRQEKKLGEVEIISMKKEKDNVERVKKGEECGLLFEPQLDFAVGDMLVSVSK